MSANSLFRTVNARLSLAANLLLLGALSPIQDAPGAEPPSLSVSRSGSHDLELRSNGFLQTARHVEGPYVDESSPAGFIAFSADEAMRFFRARSESSAVAHELLDLYWEGWASPNTDLLYSRRLNGRFGVEWLASPEQIAQGQVEGRPMPYGYGSGLQDVALENGQLLFALCEWHAATGDDAVAQLARRTFRGLKRVAEVSPVAGFVPRGPHPDGISYYRNSSRDQHMALVEALWRFSRTPFATDSDKEFIAAELDAIGRRMEQFDWKIMVEDGSHMAHVGFAWTQRTSIGAATLLGFLSMLADATGDEHWHDRYRYFSEEDNGFRWRQLLHPDAVEGWLPWNLFSNQFAQTLRALADTVTDPGKRRQIQSVLQALARHQLESDVFDPNQWRRLDWAGSWSEAEMAEPLGQCGLSLAHPTTVLELVEAFDGERRELNDWKIRRVNEKLCFGLPTVALHTALLAGQIPEMDRRILAAVHRLAEAMLAHSDRYDYGENFNRAAVLLVLAARIEACHGKERRPKQQTARGTEQ